ncbi:MAG: hypothetical protein ABI718_07660, partial [Acidobacteriota bacterium]
ILKRRAKDLFYLPGWPSAMRGTILVDEILRSLRSLKDDKLPKPRKNEGRVIRSVEQRCHPEASSEGSPLPSRLLREDGTILVDEIRRPPKAPSGALDRTYFRRSRTINR